MEEQLQMRIHGPVQAPALIYLPGLHGDWTLIGGLRRALGERVRLVEVTYPRTLTWSLDDYAAAIERGLGAQAVGRGWLLGESFGSQVAWAIAGRNTRPVGTVEEATKAEQGSAGAWPHRESSRFAIEGIILAGGFVRHPACWVVRMAAVLTGAAPPTAIRAGVWFYAKLARLRYVHASGDLAELDEFVARRTELDRRAARHRLDLTARNDPRAIARQIQVPLYALSGLIDPVVPWFWVRPWLRNNCPNLRQYRLVALSDHNVLATASRISADQIVTWVTGPRSSPPFAESSRSV